MRWPSIIVLFVVFAIRLWAAEEVSPSPPETKTEQANKATSSEVPSDVDKKTGQLIDQAGREWLDQKELRQAKEAYQQGQFATARAFVDQADTNKPNSAQIINFRGEILLAQKQFDSAELEFEKALNLDPKFSQAQFNLALVPLKKKDYTTARDRFQALLDKTQGTDKSKAAQILKFNIYIAFLLEGRERDAQKMIKEFQSADNTPAFYYSRAAWEFKHNNSAKAVDLIATGKKHYSPELNLVFADVFYDVGWLQNPPNFVAEPVKLPNPVAQPVKPPNPSGTSSMTRKEDEELLVNNVWSVKIGSREYLVQKFPAAGGNLSIDTYVDFEHDEAFVRLVRVKDTHVISSIPFRGQKVRGLQIEWNPDGKFAALSFKSGEAGIGTIRLFSVNKEGLSEMKLPNGLHVDALLPSNDPARKAPLAFEAIEPVAWLTANDLVCTVSGASRLFETAVIKAGYITISYDVTLRCTRDQKVIVVKSKQTLYENSDEQIANIDSSSSSDAELNYCERRAAAGDPVAQVNLGWMYQEGETVAQDYKKAVELYTKAAEHGYAPGQARLAAQYASGHGVTQDLDKAQNLFRKAIAQDDPIALNEFAWFLATFPDDSQRNGKLAIEYARKACDLAGWKSRNFLDTLAAAYAEDGDFNRAIMYQSDAIDKQGDYPDGLEMQRALLLYRQGKPFRDKAEK